MPDLKYAENDIGKKYSKIEKYFETATIAIKEMERQVGKPQFDENGVMTKGIIVRHLVLPNNIENSKKIIKWMKENLNKETYISIMAQYFPTYKAKTEEYKEINRKLTSKEWEEIENYIDELDFEKGFIQELGEHEEEYVPKWW